MARMIALGLSALLCVTLSLCYGLRPDFCAAVTVFPTWMWLAFGLLLAGLGRSRRRKYLLGAVVFLWLLYLVAFVEEARSLMRFGFFSSADWQKARQWDEAVRVISLNCAGGSAEAAAEVELYQPDIVLLQEPPRQKEVEQLAQRLFQKDAGTVWGVAASILARGKVSPAKLPLPSRADFVQARVRLVSGIEADVISLRLLPGIVRMDMWAWSCWQAHRQHRQAQREQLRPIVQQMDSLPRNVPLIVGGDFNAPAGDAIFRLLHPRLRDAFKEGGVGWGNTFMNDLPIIRIDQIWVNDNFRVAAVVARRTKRSDHRMVICDLILKRGFD